MHSPRSGVQLSDSYQQALTANPKVTWVWFWASSKWLLFTPKRRNSSGVCQATLLQRAAMRVKSHHRLLPFPSASAEHERSTASAEHKTELPYRGRPQVTLRRRKAGKHTMYQQAWSSVAATAAQITWRGAKGWRCSANMLYLLLQSPGGFLMGTSRSALVCCYCFHSSAVQLVGSYWAIWKINCYHWCLCASRLLPAYQPGDKALLSSLSSGGGSRKLHNCFTFICTKCFLQRKQVPFFPNRSHTLFEHTHVHVQTCKCAHAHALLRAKHFVLARTASQITFIKRQECVQTLVQFVVFDPFVPSLTVLMSTYSVLTPYLTQSSMH